MHRRHAFAVGVERHFGNAGEGRVELIFPKPKTSGRHDQGALGGVAHGVETAGLRAIGML